MPVAADGAVGDVESARDLEVAHAGEVAHLDEADQARVELADLLEALRTQLVLARYEGSPADDASAIVSEVWARLEGLGAVLDPGSSDAQSTASN